jgi:hypothetical protein
VSAAACASVQSAVSRVIIELGGVTYVARPVQVENVYRVEVDRAEHAVEAPQADARPAKRLPRRDASAVATLERVTAKLSKRFADPEAGGLYRAALRDLGIAYRGAGEHDKAMAALRLCESLCALALEPTERDEELRERVALDLRGAPTLDIDERRWLPFLDEENR